MSRRKIGPLSWRFANALVRVLFIKLTRAKAHVGLQANIFLFGFGPRLLLFVTAVFEPEMVLSRLGSGL